MRFRFQQEVDQEERGRWCKRVTNVRRGIGRSPCTSETVTSSPAHPKPSWDKTVKWSKNHFLTKQTFYLISMSSTFQSLVFGTQIPLEWNGVQSKCLANIPVVLWKQTSSPSHRTKPSCDKKCLMHNFLIAISILACSVSRPRVMNILWIKFYKERRKSISIT